MEYCLVKTLTNGNIVRERFINDQSFIAVASAKRFSDHPLVESVILLRNIKLK